MKILIIEDEKIINNNIRSVFESDGFVVEQAFDGLEGSNKLNINKYDCCIVDINLPRQSGIEMINLIRKNGDTTPAIFLTARDNFNDMERAFSIGADDYLVKPFDLKVLILKVKAIIKRNNNSDSIIHLKELTIDLDLKSVFRGINEVPLTAKEFGILELLLLRRGRFVNSEEILSNVWGDDVDEFTKSVKIHISNLRKKLGSIIISKRLFGYKIC
jgi:DNA-binding response OmpR family regulator